MLLDYFAALQRNMEPYGPQKKWFQDVETHFPQPPFLVTCCLSRQRRPLSPWRALGSLPQVYLATMSGDPDCENVVAEWCLLAQTWQVIVQQILFWSVGQGDFSLSYRCLAENMEYSPKTHGETDGLRWFLGVPETFSKVPLFRHRHRNKVTADDINHFPAPSENKQVCEDTANNYRITDIINREMRETNQNTS